MVSIARPRRLVATSRLRSRADEPRRPGILDAARVDEPSHEAFPARDRLDLVKVDREVAGGSSPWKAALVLLQQPLELASGHARQSLVLEREEQL